MFVGYDNKGQKLELGDICRFKIGMIEYEGMICYEDSEYAFVFEMKEDKFPCVLMNRANLNSIEKIINVWSTKIDDEYDFYRQLTKGRIIS